MLSTTGARLIVLLDEEAAPLFYWTVPECCLSVVCACLPTLRPVFRGWSAESIFGTMRNVFSFSSLRSRSHERSGASDTSQGARNSKTFSPSFGGESSKNLVGFRKMSCDQPYSGVMAVFENTFKRADVEQIDLGDLERGGGADGGIRMQRRFEQTEVRM